MTATDAFLSASRELSDALDYLSPSDAAKLGARLAALKGSQRVTKDGDVLTEKEYDVECANIRELLLSYIEKHGELSLEGIGTWRVQSRRTTNYDVPAIAEKDPKLLAALLEYDCLKVDPAKVKAHAERLLGLRKWMYEGQQHALVLEKER